MGFGEESRAVEEGNLSKQKSPSPPPTRAKGRYSHVTRRIWNSESFNALTHPAPCGGWLWFRILTGPELTNIPGLFQTRETGLAEALRWPLEGLREAFAEVVAEGMAEADWSTGLVWVPNAVHHHPPESPNTVKSWRDAWEELPTCQLKLKAFLALEAWCKAKGEPWAKAFEMACAKPTPKANGKTCPNQNQNQNQRQNGSDQILTAAGSQRPGSSERTGRSAAAAAPEDPNSLAARARAVLDNPHDGQYSQPSKWPEVLRITKAWSEPYGLKDLKLRDHVDADSDLRAVLEAIADGYDPEILESLGLLIPTDEYLRSRKAGGPRVFTPAVIRTLLAKRPDELDAASGTRKVIDLDELGIKLGAEGM